MTTENIDLSVIIACSRVNTAISCLQGLEQQNTNKHFEVIVVGDINGLAHDQFTLNLKLIPCAKTHANVRRNLGISHAKAPLIGFLDDDAIPEPSWVHVAIRHCDSNSHKVLTGPEKPADSGEISRLVFAVSQNVLSEATCAHVNQRHAQVSWADVPFCNCVIPRKIFDHIGMLATDIPWDMDDFEFFLRARHTVMFENIPELSIRHDRYPNSVRRFLAYKWKLRMRTGEKLVTHPHIYLRIFPVLVTALFPWIFLAAGLALPVSCSTVIIGAVLLYTGLIASQTKIALEHCGARSFLYLGVMVALHLLTGVGVQVGILKGVLHQIRKLVSFQST